MTRGGDVYAGIWGVSRGMGTRPCVVTRDRARARTAAARFGCFGRAASPLAGATEVWGRGARIYEIERLGAAFVSFGTATGAGTGTVACRVCVHDTHFTGSPPGYSLHPTENPTELPSTDFMLARTCIGSLVNPRGATATTCKASWGAKLVGSGACAPRGGLCGFYIRRGTRA